MVNKKLSSEDEESIYMEWLTGVPLATIATKFPVVISTIQRVVKKKSRLDDSKKNYIISNVFKHIKNASQPLDMAVKIFEGNDQEIHQKQKELLVETLKKLSDNIDKLLESVGHIN